MMCDHLRDSVEAALRALIAKPTPSASQNGQMAAYMWILDLIDFSNLETESG